MAIHEEQRDHCREDGHAFATWLREVTVASEAHSGSTGMSGMEMISRRAYGFRNFENYRLRVRELCCSGSALEGPG